MSGTFVTEAEVRALLNVSGVQGTFSASQLGSNAALASELIEQETHRLFTAQTGTKTFTTRNQPSLAIPDLRSATAVTHLGSALDANAGYYLIPDRMNSGVFVRIELPSLSPRGDYRRYPDWFDRNLDSPLYRGQLEQGLPNDLAITGAWGHDPVPAGIKRATTILAAWLTRRTAALLANALITADGGALDYSAWPPEVRHVVDAWRIRDQAVATVG